MDVSKNRGFSTQIIHFNRVFHYFYHPFWGTPIFGNTHILHHYQVDLSFLKIFGHSWCMYLFQPKVEICRFLRLMQFVLQLSGHGETWSFKIWHFEMFEMWVARSSNNKTNNKKRCSWRFLCKWLNINVFVVFCICCCHVPGLKGRRFCRHPRQSWSLCRS